MSHIYLNKSIFKHILNSLSLIFHKISFIGVLFFSLSISCNQNTNDVSQADTIVSIEKGKSVFKQYCISCHGVDGTLGLNGAMNLQETKLTKQEKIQVISQGRKLMLSFNNILKPNEIESVALYVETLSDIEID